MTIERKTFFDALRGSPFGGQLLAPQVDGMTRILDEWETRKLQNLDWLAYMLATVFHETAKTMQPVKEYGSDTYLKGKTYWPWIGRGLVQVTWEANYLKFGCTNPDDMLTWPFSLRALFDGMIQGVFTGKKLGDYFTDKLHDAVGARRIINGTDKAATVATYHNAFRAALATANHPLPRPVDIPPIRQPVPPDPEPEGFWARLVSAFNRKAS